MRILPDGRVEIKNSQTGETRIVKPEELPKYGIPPLSGQTNQTQLQNQPPTQTQTKYITGRSAEEHYSAYQTAVNAGDKTAATQIYKNFQDETTYQEKQTKKTEISDSERKSIDAKTNADRIITQLEDLYYGGAGTEGDLSAGRLGGLTSTIAQKIGLNQPLSTYTAAKMSDRPTLARAAGDVGNLSLPEQQAAVMLLPSQYSTPQEARKGFEAIREKFGLPKRNLDEVTTDQKPGPTGIGILDQLIGYGQDVGTGLALKSKSGQEMYSSLDQSSEMAGQLEQQAQKISDPEAVKRLLGLAKEVRGNVSQTTKGIESSFSPDIEKGYVGRGFDTATNIAMIAEIPSLIRAIPSLGKKLTGIKTPEKIIGTIRDTAISKAEEAGIKFSGTGAKKAAEEYVTRNPLAKNIADKILPTIKDTMSPTEFMKRIKIWNNAYTGAGKVGKSALAGFYDALAKGAKEEILKKAPEISKATGMFAKYYKGKKILNRFIFPAIISYGVYRGISSIGGNPGGQ